jgi:hypothetical protein
MAGLSGDQILGALSAGAGTIFSTLVGTQSAGVNSPAPAGTVTPSAAPPVGNSTAPPTVKSFPTWGYFAVAAGVLLLILFLKRR